MTLQFADLTLMESELVLNADGSVYHLNLLPEEIADTIILVGDPNRVKQVSKYFDRIEVQKTKREFVTHTGFIGKKHISVVGTGIGAGNIDITMNELDALHNIDLKNRVVKTHHKKLNFIRMGTSGALQDYISVDSLLVSSFAVGLDGLVLYYDWKNTEAEKKLLIACQEKFSATPFLNTLYVAAGAKSFIDLFEKNHLGLTGITLTCPGFYGPQNRQLRAQISEPGIFSVARQVKIENHVITNLEMETAAIYGMARLLNHDACSINAILANRFTHTFSNDPDRVIEQMIQKVLTLL